MPRPRAIMGVRIRSERYTMAKEPSAAEREAAAAAAALIAGSRERWSKALAAVEDSFGIRPALVLPSNALFDTDTLILKGVA